jgi:hypothetical protein
MTEGGVIMKRGIKRSWGRPVILVLAAALLFTASCASAPPAEQTPVAGPKAVPAPAAEYEKAKGLRAAIMEKGLDGYVPEVFTEAEADFKGGESTYGEDNEASTRAFGRAIMKYQEIMDQGYPRLADTWRAKAENARMSADLIKASQSMPDEYNAALGLCAKADAAFAAKDYPACVELFTAAAQQFDNAAMAAGEKMSRAEKSLTELADGLTKAESQAVEAEKAKDSVL